MDITREAAKVYNDLEDRESKEIFLHRLLYSVTGDIEYIDRIVRGYVREYAEYGRYDEDQFRSFAGQALERAGDRKIVIYGAGFNGGLLREALREGKPQYFCDRKAVNGAYEYMGLPVITVPDLLRKEKAGDILMVVSSYTFAEEIVPMLLDCGFPRENVMVPSGNMGIYCSKRQYFDPGIVRHRPGVGEVFIDGGCFDGKDLLAFSAWCGREADRMLAFEPNAESARQCEAFIRNQGLSNVSLYQNGLWDCREAVCFHESGQGFRAAEEMETPERIAMETIDSVCEREGILPTFIKLDIEGSEMRALQGGAATIRKAKPDMAVCVYHRPEDVIALPLLVKELVPEYRIYMRHYGNWIYDTVMYAVVGRG